MILGMSGTKLPQHHNCNKIPKVDAGRVAADRKKRLFNKIWVLKE